jgi:hypothetical protein
MGVTKFFNKIIWPKARYFYHKQQKLAKDILHHVSVDPEQKKRLELEQAEAAKESISFNKITNKIIFYS